MKGKIIKISRFCVDDGPGIRTVVFLKGCPLRCIWCHNPESQKTENEIMYDDKKCEKECSANEIEWVGKSMTAEEILEEAEKDLVFYQTSGGGVTISGGEPLFQADFTAEILKRCKGKGIHTAIETSGFSSEASLKKVLQYCDLVLFDIKETDEENHKKFTGVSLSQIMKNLDFINKRGVSFIIRLPIIPGLNDREEHFNKVKSLAENMRFCQGVEIMPYHKLGAYKYDLLKRKYLCSHIEEPDDETVDKWKNFFN